MRDYVGYKGYVNFFPDVKDYRVLEDLLDVYYHAYGCSKSKEYTIGRVVKLKPSEYLKFLENLTASVNFLRPEDVGYDHVVFVTMKGEGSLLVDEDFPGILVVSDGTCKVCEVSWLECD